MNYRIILIIPCLLLLSCTKDPVGTPCVRKGDGFTARHNCETLCMSIWRITCPDGSIGDSKVCGGKLNCSRGSCAAGQVCYQTNFDRSVCVPESICADWSDPSTHPAVELKELKKRPKPLTATAPAMELKAE